MSPLLVPRVTQHFDIVCVPWIAGLRAEPAVATIVEPLGRANPAYKILFAATRVTQHFAARPKSLGYARNGPPAFSATSLDALTQPTNFVFCSQATRLLLGVNSDAHMMPRFDPSHVSLSSVFDRCNCFGGAGTSPRNDGARARARRSRGRYWHEAERSRPVG